MQKAVDVYFRLNGSETVVGASEEQRLVPLGSLEHLPQEGIEPGIEVEENIVIGSGGRGIVEKSGAAGRFR